MSMIPLNFSSSVGTGLAASETNAGLNTSDDDVVFSFSLLVWSDIPSLVSCFPLQQLHVTPILQQRHKTGYPV